MSRRRKWARASLYVGSQVVGAVGDALDLVVRNAWTTCQKRLYCGLERHWSVRKVSYQPLKSASGSLIESVDTQARKSERRGDWWREPCDR